MNAGQKETGRSCNLTELTFISLWGQRLHINKQGFCALSSNEKLNVLIFKKYKLGKFCIV